jgi:uncharacterized coiled-coil DUF342 family protein
MGSNGNGLVTAEEYHQRAREAQETVERLRAERDRLDYAIEGWEQRHEEIMGAAARAGVAEMAEQGVKRSLMTPLQKSRFIREHGKAKYDMLPWKWTGA